MIQGKLDSLKSLKHLSMYLLLSLIRAFLPLRSDEADDGAGECGAEPEHSPGQHPETVRG